MHAERLVLAVFGSPRETRTSTMGNHPLGRVQMWRGDIRFGVVCCRPFRLTVP